MSERIVSSGSKPRPTTLAARALLPSGQLRQQGPLRRRPGST